MIAWFIIALATIAFFAFIAMSGAATISATDAASSRAQTINRINSAIEMLASQSAAPFSDGVVYAPVGQATSDGYLLPRSMQPAGITSFGTKFIYCPVGAPLTSSNATVTHPGGSYGIRTVEVAGKRYVTQSNLAISGALDPKIIGFVIAPLDSRTAAGGCNQITPSGGAYTVPNGIVRALSRTLITDLDATMESGGSIWYVTPQGGGNGSSWSSPATLDAAFSAYRESSGGSFLIQIADGNYVLNGNPLNKDTIANPEKHKGSSLTMESPSSARLSIGQINVPTDLTIKRLIIEDSITSVNPGKRFTATNSSVGSLILERGSTATLTGNISVNGQPSTNAAIYQMSNSQLNVSSARVSIAYQNGIPSIVAEPGSKTTVSNSVISIRPGTGSAANEQTYGFYFHPQTRITLLSSTINIDGHFGYGFFVEGNLTTVSSAINTNASVRIALYTQGGNLKLRNITIAGSSPAVYALASTSTSSINGNGNLYSTFRCWNRDYRGTFRMSETGIEGNTSGVSADEVQLPVDSIPTAQQARDYQLTAARNTDRALLRSRGDQVGGEFSCQSSGTANTWIKCADENGYCKLPYYAAVRYGANNSYTTMRRGDGIPCNNATFGDPAQGAVKACYYQSEKDT